MNKVSTGRDYSLTTIPIICRDSESYPMSLLGLPIINPDIFIFATQSCTVVIYEVEYKREMNSLEKKRGNKYVQSVQVEKGYIVAFV